MYPGVHAATVPDRAAVVMAGSGRWSSYGELEARSARLAHVFRDAGLRPGDAVALLTDNRLEAFEVYWAAMRSGLYLTAVNSHLAAGEVDYVVGDARAGALVVSDALGGLVAELGEQPDVVLRLAFDGSLPGFDDYGSALARSSPEPPRDQPHGADLLYSSGTTGRPKGVRVELPDRQVDEPGDLLTPVLEGLYGFGPGMVYLSPAPVYHAAPLRFAAAVHKVGGTVVVMEKFEPEAALRAIERFGVTHSQWVPTMFVRMLKLDDQVRAGFDLSTHRVAIHAAAPCPVPVKRAMIDWWGPVLYEYYASTEGIGMTFIDSREWLQKPGSVGRAALGAIRICGDGGEELPPGRTGTVYFEREDEVAFEYLGDPDKTRSARHPRHPSWFTTDDVGHVDEDGYLFLTDRKSFMIISGGVNIYPQEVEDVLALHPALVDVAVIGVPDEEMGEVVRAVVQPAAGADPGPELERELLEHVRARIARYKAPRAVDFVDELPRTPTGKLVKGKLRERYAGASA